MRTTLAALAALLTLLTPVTVRAAEDFRAAFDAAQYGSMITMPEIPADGSAPAGWMALSKALSDTGTPGWQTWSQQVTGRVLVIYRLNKDGHLTDEVKVVGATMSSEERAVILWLPDRVLPEGGGWRLSDRLPAPTRPAASVEPARPEPPAAPTEWATAPVGTIVRLTPECPRGWVARNASTPKVGTPWTVGYLGELLEVVAVGQAPRRVRYIVASLTDRGDGQYAAVLWFPEGDAVLLSGRQWDQILPARPARTDEVGEEVPADPNPPTPPTPRPNPGNEGDWLLTTEQLAALPLGAVITLPAGLDWADPPAGWSAGIETDPAWKPGQVVQSRHGRAVVIRVTLPETPQQRLTVGYWYPQQPTLGPGAAEEGGVITGSTPAVLDTVAVGTRFRLPADLAYERPFGEWARVGHFPITASARPVEPGTIAEITLGDQRYKVLVVGVGYNQADPTQWRVSVWGTEAARAATRPGGDWRLVLPSAPPAPAAR